MGVMIERDPLEDSDPRTAKEQGRRVDAPSADEMLEGEVEGYGVLPGEEGEAEGEELTPAKVLRFIQSAEPTASQFFQEKAMSKILTVYRAARNEHPENSKYTKPLYKNRASFHRPKTRNAIRRMQTAAANALFQARDVIEVSAQDESNPQHKMAALLKKEIVNYRLSRSSGRNAIPWFETAIGARTDAYMTGYSISMQSWSYRRQQIGEEPMVDQRTGQPIRKADGTPVMKAKWRMLIDRPEVTLHPIENVGIDPAAPWQDPAQNANFIFVKEPLYRAEIEAVMEQAGDHSNIPWRPIDEIDWSAGRVEQGQDARSVRTGRADGSTDRYEDGTNAKESEDGNALVWRYIWFFRWDGEDYVVYTLGTRELLSDPIKTIDAFPALGGQRPIVIGTDVIAPHDLMPLSNAAALQPMQQEINDQVNLRIDAIRQSVFPLAKIVRGKNIDAMALTRRGPNTNVLVENKDDVTYEVTPNGSAALFAEHDRLNNDFDETAGIFSNSSVQSNRTMNETVGGMKILAGDAQAVSNLELRIWTETWAERVIGQIMLLCSYYETDAKVLAICGQRAGLFDKFGVDEITDELLLAEVQCVVDIGLGANDPGEAIGRFKMAMDTVFPYLQQDIASGKVALNAKEIINEVFGAAQFKDAGERFVTIQGDTPDPMVLQLQQQLAEVQAELDAIKNQKAAEKEIQRMKTEGDLAKIDREAQWEERQMLLEAQREQIMTLLGFGLDQRAAIAGDQRKASMAADADSRKAGIAAEGDMRKAGMAAAADGRKASMAEQSDQRQAMLAPPAAPGGAPGAASGPPAAAAPAAGSGGPPALRGPAGAPPSPMEAMPQIGSVLDQLVGGLGQTIGAAMMQMMQMQQQQQAETMQMIAALGERMAANQQSANDTLIRALTAPKVAIRDEEGRIVGSRVQLN